jgi:hypothetical protein
VAAKRKLEMVSFVIVLMFAIDAHREFAAAAPIKIDIPR